MSDLEDDNVYSEEEEQQNFNEKRRREYDEEEEEEEGEDAGGLEQQDEDDDEEEEEESEEEEDNGRKKKKRRRVANPFIEEEADVDDEEDEEEEEEDGYEDEIGVDKEEMEELEKTYLDENRHRYLNQRIRKEEDFNAEEIAQKMKQRYGRSELSRGAYRGDVDHVPQNMLIPSVQDPKLWLVRCKPGKEKDIVFNLMRKYFDKMFTAPLQILSAFSRDGLSGYVYIEAEKQAFVTQAIEQMNNIYGSSMQLVPVAEMVDCLTIKTKDVAVKLGQWVRCKRGKYGGDLGQILEIADSGENLIVKLIPRLEPRHEVNRTSLDGKKKKSEIRPPQKLFNPNDFSARDYTQTQNGYNYKNEFFDKSGFLEKDMKLSSLETVNVNPTLEEITRFSGGVLSDRGDELAALANANIATANDFQVGENIVIQSGELRNVPGVVQSVENEIVTILPDKSSGLSGTFRYPAKNLAKRFAEGDHVRVMNGVHKDETGLVLKIEDNIVSILSDMSLTPIQVFSKDLRIAAEISTTTSSVGQYSLSDLVQLSPNEVGVITKVEKDMLMILNQYGSVQRVRPQQIRNKRDSSRAVTSDANGKPVTASDTVVVDDPSSVGNKKRATVIHVYRSFLFLQSREIIENNGVFVARSSSVSLLGGKGVLAGPDSGRGGRGGSAIGGMNGRGGMNRGRGRGRADPLISKTVIVSSGPYKGYLGIVKDVTDTHARLELHTHNRTINIEKAKITIAGENGGARGPTYNSYGSDSMRNRSMDGGKTPMYTSSSRTPNPYDSGSRTPAWEAGSRTPAWNAGSKTPAWDSGSRTPAWDSGSRTPAHPSSFGNPFTPSASFGSGVDKTTPFNPTTPGFGATPYNPQTPAAPTPRSGAYPAANPTTPFAPATPFQPSTPAAHGGAPSQAAPSKDTPVLDAWLLENIEVKFISKGSQKFQNGAYDGKHAVVQSADASRRVCTVRLLGPDDKSTVIPNVHQDFLVPVPPERRQRFKAIASEHFGAVGSLLSIDGNEGVVRIDKRTDIIMMNMTILARLVTE